jgi:hypothetical protein
MGLFSRLVSGSTTPVAETHLDSPPDGPLEEMIVSGAAFGNFRFEATLLDSHTLCREWAFQPCPQPTSSQDEVRRFLVSKLANVTS